MMGSMMDNQPNEPIQWDQALAMRMHQQGLTYAQIASIFGVSRDTAHCRVDPDYRRKRQDQKNAQRQYDSVVRAQSHYARSKIAGDVEARLAEIPTDTRGFTARMFGDPVFERSAAAKPQVLIRKNITLPYVSILGGAE